jgi:hypothetical protein
VAQSAALVHDELALLPDDRQFQTFFEGLIRLEGIESKHLDFPATVVRIAFDVDLLHEAEGVLELVGEPADKERIRPFHSSDLEGRFRLGSLDFNTDRTRKEKRPVVE